MRILDKINFFFQRHKSVLYSGIISLLALFIFGFPMLVVSSDNYWSVVAVIIAIFTALIPIYIELYKINKSIITPVSLQSTLDPINDTICAYPDKYNYAVIKSAGINVVYASYGYIREIRVVGGVLGEVTIYDNTAGSGQEIVPTVVPNKGQVLKKDAGFMTGLTIVSEKDTLITVSYR